MSTNEPMTQGRLDAIRKRLDSVEFLDNEHLTAINAEEPLVSWIDRSHIDGSIISGDLVATVHAGPRSAEMFAHAPEDLADLLAEVERLRPRADLADAMIERVARDTAAKESFTGRRQWEDLTDYERTYLREHAYHVLAADLTPKKNAGLADPAALDALFGGGQA